MIKGHNADNLYEHTLDHAVEFFSKAGSLYTGKGTYYGGEESALALFQKMWIVEPDTSMKLLFWLRDPRGGAGNRSGARACWHWLATNDQKWADANLHLLTKYGRWDDLRSLFGTPLEEQAASVWANALKEKDVLAAKWCDRSDFPVRKMLEMKVGPFRRFLAALRRQHIVEHKMCTSQWKEIEYPHVPSVAMSRYTNAFKKHDEEGFAEFKEAVKKGEVEIKASVLFPHDCVRTAQHGDAEVADLQFEALPNYMPEDEKILMLCDTSGSMCAPVDGGSSVQRIHVSMGLSLYCSAKMPTDSPFYKKFIKFESEDKLVSWEGRSFSEALEDREIFDGACGSTNIGAALRTILVTAKMFSVAPENMPTSLVIVSDNQFDSMVEDDSDERTVAEQYMQKWEEAGYSRPKIVYWNVAGYAGSPATVKMPNTGLVSGFSAAILKAIFEGTDFSPRAIMERAIGPYEIVIP